jgi:hypothetical protein
MHADKEHKERMLLAQGISPQGNEGEGMAGILPSTYCTYYNLVRQAPDEE